MAQVHGGMSEPAPMTVEQAIDDLLGHGIVTRERVDALVAIVRAEKPKPMRKIISTTPETFDKWMKAYCDDGTVWLLKENTHWIRSKIPPIPQD